MRIPYVADPPPSTSPSDDAIVARIRARRAPRPLLHLDLALLHSPPLADGWNSFLGAIRTQSTLGADLRELAICRVAVCNKAWFEWSAHAPLARKGGVPEQGMEAIKVERLPEARLEGLTQRQWVVVLYADEMTRNVEVKDETFELLKKEFNDREIVELTTTVRHPLPLLGP